VKVAKRLKQWFVAPRYGSMRWKLRERYRNLRQSWPWVPQYKHKRELQYLKDRLTQQEREFAEARKEFDAVVPKLVKLSYDRPFDQPDRFRLILELSPYLIRDAFQFGNDQRMIEEFGHAVGMMAAHELRTANLHRFEGDLYSRRGYEFPRFTP